MHTLCFRIFMTVESVPICGTNLAWCVSLFLQWVRMKKRDFARANLVLQRVARDVWGSSREVWITERASTILQVWHRYAVFCRCKRYGQGIPYFPVPIPNWTMFIDEFQNRQLRARVSQQLMPKVRSLGTKCVDGFDLFVVRSASSSQKSMASQCSAVACLTARALMPLFQYVLPLFAVHYPSVHALVVDRREQHEAFSKSDDCRHQLAQSAFVNAVL